MNISFTHHGLRRIVQRNIHPEEIKTALIYGNCKLESTNIQKYEYADLFGVVGDPNTKYKNLAGIFEYKRKIGGDLIEFIGEFDFIAEVLQWTKIKVQ